MEEPSNWVTISLVANPDDYLADWMDEEDDSEDDLDWMDEDENARFECSVDFLLSWSRLTTVKRRICVHVLMGILLKELLPFRARQCSSELDAVLEYLGNLHTFYELGRSRCILPMEKNQRTLLDWLSYHSNAQTILGDASRSDRPFWKSIQSTVAPYLRAVGPACHYRKYEEQNFVGYALEALVYLTDTSHRSKAPVRLHEDYFIREMPDAEILLNRFSKCAMDWFNACKKALAWRTALVGEYVN